MNVKMLTDLFACKESIDWFVENCKDNCSTEEAINILYENNHPKSFEWSNWLIVRLLNDANKIKYAVFAAREVLPIFEKRYPKDLRPRLALEAAEKFISDGSEVNKDTARAAADAAYDAADAAAAPAARVAAYAAAAARAAAYAADAAAYAFYDAARAYADVNITKKIIQYGFKLLKEQQPHTAICPECNNTVSIKELKLLCQCPHCKIDFPFIIHDKQQ